MRRIYETFRRSEYSDGAWCEYTYNNCGKIIHAKEDSGYSYELTYNNNGQELTFKDSDGFSRESTYDEKGQILTHHKKHNSTL